MKNYNLPCDIKKIIRNKYFGSREYWKKKYSLVIKDINKSKPYLFLQIYPDFSNLYNWQNGIYTSHMVLRVRKHIMDSWDSSICGWTRSWKRARKTPQLLYYTRANNI